MAKTDFKTTSTTDFLAEAINYYYNKNLPVFPVKIWIAPNEKTGELKKRMFPAFLWEKERDKINRETALKAAKTGKYNSLALLTGPETDCFVIDFDIPDKTGLKSFLNSYGVNLSEIPRSRTQSGGLHAFFKFPKIELDYKTTTAKPSKGVDLRGEGGLVFLPPSRVQGGGTYEWIQEINGSLPEAGPEILAMLDSIFSKEKNNKEKASKEKLLKKLSQKQREITLQKLEKSETSGDRSGADFNLVCWLINCKISRDDIFELVSDVGKFAEKAGAGLLNDYFDRTFENAFIQANKDQAERVATVNQAALSETSRSGGAEDQVQAEFPELENLEILGVTETEKVKVYSKDTNTLHEINLSTLKPVGLTQISGKVFDRASFQNAINFIALKARKNQLARFETRSQGISGLPENELIIVSGETAYFFNGKLSEINHPIYKNIEIKFKNGGSWFNPKCVGLNNYKESFCRLLEIVSQWNFESSLSAKLITSMLFATPMQSLFRWRPHVYLTGAAGSAKTLFFQNIFKPLFGNLGLSLEGDNSGAGIRQAINDSFYCVSLDETEGRNENYEKNKAYILEMLKISNRGGKMIRGGKDGVSSTFSLCHSFWLASIEVAITDPANLGRYIVTELKRPGNIVLPTQNELSQIFDSIVSFCLNNYVKILNKIEETRVSYRGDLKDSRLIETYSVPLTILGMLMGESISGNLDKVHESGKTELKPDHEMLLDEIFSSIIPIEYEKATIGSLIERNVLGDMPDKLLNRHLLNFGLKLTESNKKAVIAFHPDTIKQNLLFKSHFKSIKDVLMRHPNATGKRLRFNLRNVEAVTIPIDFLFDLSE